MMDIQSRTVLALTSKSSRALVNQYHNHRIFNLLKYFDLTYGKVIALLSLHHSIIVGCYALLVVLPEWSTIADRIKPRTIEFVVPRSRSITFVMDICDMFTGYSIYPHTDPHAPPSYLQNHETFVLCNLPKNPFLPQADIRWILIHVSQTDVAYHRVFHADLTAQINFISDRGVFSAYPTMTCEGYSLTRSNDHDDRIDNQFRSWGFHIGSFPEVCNLRGIAHERCGGGNLSCPYSVRSSLDSECHFAVVPIKTVHLTPSHLLPINISRPCIIWVFDAGKCGGICSPRDVVIIDSHVQQN